MKSLKLRQLKSPWKIQEFVHAIPYNPGSNCASAAGVLAQGVAHCMEGGLLAADLLERIGHEPRMLHLRSHRDDDHVVALFKEKGLWGAVGKSNTTLLGWRAPVYRTVESLAHSYFPFYFNTKGQMSLVAWSGPIRLNKYLKRWNWKDGEEDVGDLSLEFYEETAWEIFTPAQIERLPTAPSLLTDACFLGANRKGLYRA
jgi:hypothetical protein